MTETAVQTAQTQPRFIAVGEDARSIAVRSTPAGAGEGAPGVLWCGGYLSDMRGGKAEALASWGAETGRPVVRFDYSGHGESGGRFIDGTISRWAQEALAVFDAETRGPQVVVGSSMGGWIALLLARALAARGGEPRLAGLVLIAPAPDFSEELMWKAMTPEIRAEILEKGVWYRESEHGTTPITRAFIEDGRAHLVLGAPFAVGCPVRILQGVADDVVPWQHALRLSTCLAEDDVVVTLVKDGDHRLSRPEDMARILDAVASIG
ncbi:alpha/beta hydrolase [Ancylobacter amanitiformis]|uniref:Pimeloyl-ACP methyl ester carboxylesterase n=1 Tax=Ancylobacter amanitiformis TaxID=217069 RepID=A0ABU0LQZ0_9HYPH|nr:alpha/beta hydrolase [Ancylobacter amanitiformis]MDQ0511083.1 pimeloyl-ACP methyl ester carboxylesterase [Ancylobacter amanitiformis]